MVELLTYISLAYHRTRLPKIGHLIDRVDQALRKGEHNFQQFIPSSYAGTVSLRNEIDQVNVQLGALRDTYHALGSNTPPLPVGGMARVVYGVWPGLRYWVPRSISSYRALSNLRRLDLQVSRLQDGIAKHLHKILNDMRTLADQLLKQCDTIKQLITDLTAKQVNMRTLPLDAATIEQRILNLRGLTVYMKDLYQGLGIPISGSTLDEELKLLSQYRREIPPVLEQLETAFSQHTEIKHLMDGMPTLIKTVDAAIAIVAPTFTEHQVYMSKAASLKQQLKDASCAFQYPSINNLPTLKANVTAVKHGLEKLWAAAEALEKAYAELQQAIQLMLKDADALVNKVRELEDRKEYSLRWSTSRDDFKITAMALLDKARQAASLNDVRSLPEVEQRTKLVQALSERTAQFMKRFDDIAAQYTELVDLLRKGELSDGFAWYRGIKKADDQAHQSGFVVGNWGDLRVEELLGDAARLVDQQRKLVLDCVQPNGMFSRLYVHEPDAYTPYEAGLYRLLIQLPHELLYYNSALTYQQRLLENIDRSRKYGDTETRRAERAEICDGLNTIALTVYSKPFDEFCNKPYELLDSSSYLIPEQLLGRSIQEAKQIQQQIKRLVARANRTGERLKALVKRERVVATQVDALRTVVQRIESLLANLPDRVSVLGAKDTMKTDISHLDELHRRIALRKVGLLEEKAQLASQLSQELPVHLREIYQAINDNSRKRAKRFDTQIKHILSVAPDLHVPSLTAAQQTLETTPIMLPADQPIEKLSDAIESLVNWRQGILRNGAKVKADVGDPLASSLEALRKIQKDVDLRFEKLRIEVEGLNWPPVSYNLKPIEQALDKLNSMTQFAGADIPAVQRSIAAVKLLFEDVIRLIDSAHTDLDNQRRNLLTIYGMLAQLCIKIDKYCGRLDARTQGAIIRDMLSRKDGVRAELEALTGKRQAHDAARSALRLLRDKALIPLERADDWPLEVHMIRFEHRQTEIIIVD